MSTGAYVLGFGQASTALLGALIGAAAGVLGGFLTGWRQSKLEREKWLRARQDTVRADGRDALTDLARTLAAGAHSMMWSTYKALSAGVVQPEDVRVYEQEIHQAISEMVSSQMRIAALDDALFQRVTPLISEAIRMGGDTFLALSAATQDLSNDQPLLDCNRSALALIKRVPIELSNLLRS